jgi:hypothetical protein
LLAAQPLRSKTDRETKKPAGPNSTDTQTATNQRSSDTAKAKNLGEQLAAVLCDKAKPEPYHCFRIVESINAALVDDMNDLLHTGNDIVAEQEKKPADAQRRLRNNIVTLLGSAHLWWASYKLHSAVMPAQYAQGLHMLYGARVCLELLKDTRKALAS